MHTSHFVLRIHYHMMTGVREFCIRNCALSNSLAI